MEIIKIENLSFEYPNKGKKALDGICISVKSGEFITICGKSGCGKTTLLRLLKSAIAPHGTLCGEIYFESKPLADIDSREQASKIGFVMQSPDNQIVTDKVWHELAFGLEGLGYSTAEIRTRVSEMASFFGIQNWFYKSVTELSGGQKQLLNLASVMVMQPSVLILDEPTSQLDPIAASEFLGTLEKINRELGVTVILSEHRLSDAFPISDRVIVMDEGIIIADGNPQDIGKELKKRKHDMYLAMPAPMRIHGAVESNLPCPVDVREGSKWLTEYLSEHPETYDFLKDTKETAAEGEAVIECSDIWFRYEKDSDDVVKGLNLSVRKGELFSIVGGNGTGKTTALSLISGLYVPYRGKILIGGKDISKSRPSKDILTALPQNPQSVFVKKTVYLDLMDMLSEEKISEGEKERRILEISRICRIERLLQSHPYDLSGGEQQRAALAKVLLAQPEILLLDEPTKGLDSHFKLEFARILESLRLGGVTVVMVSHDIEFCAEFSDWCALFFDGGITSIGKPREFFGGKSFYTTTANRMARNKINDAVLTSDVILALGGKCEQYDGETPPPFTYRPKEEKKKEVKEKKKKSPLRIIFGIVFFLLFALTSALYFIDVTALSFLKKEFFEVKPLDVISFIEIVAAFLCFFARQSNTNGIVSHEKKGRFSGRTLLATLFVLIAIPLTIFIGVYYLGDKKYYFISLMIIFETFLPFCTAFESRRPRARELVLISVLCAIAVAGRAAFFMLPQFKPIIAIVIISGICLGGETGFLVGAVSGFVSNFFFGQGPWTPWQMFAFGIIGFLAGILSSKGLLSRSRTSLCIFGFFMTLIFYGGIMNPASVITSQPNPSWDTILSAYAVGLPFDAIHGLSTAFFLWFISEPMLEKIERIRVKYGLID